MAATPAAGGENPYGLMQALNEGGLIAYATFGILVLMSVASWYIFFVKLFEQQKIINQGRRARTTFWQSANLREGAQKLEKNSAHRQIVDDGITALEQHDKLTDPIDQHDWMLNSLARSQGAISSRLSTGLALLATVGSTAPFIGLFGTVVGIYRALIRIGTSGQASIDAVAGPVGEALIMTALGLVVAVPAVMQYNWLMRRNKSIGEDLARFSNDLHGYMMSGGTVRPVTATRGGGTAGGATGGTTTGGTTTGGGAASGTAGRTSSTSPGMGGAGSGTSPGGAGSPGTGGVGLGGSGGSSPGGTTSTGSAIGTNTSGPKKV